MTVLRHRDFRNLFLGHSLSALGDRIVFVALALSVTEIGSPTDGGLVLAAHGLPLVVPAFVLAGFGIALFGIWWETGSSARRARASAAATAISVGRVDVVSSPSP